MFVFQGEIPPSAEEGEGLMIQVRVDAPHHPKFPIK